ncbi:MAG: formate--tetrahydrofolate ligase [Deltaproteobacteria bacterium]|nr:formate--tetrahydrofolate ligase [Deltaproteobacteria bacterium]
MTSINPSPTTLPIATVAERLGVAAAHVLPYGRDKAKLDLAALAAPRRREGSGRLVLVSAITPTRAGEGKTTTTIGLGQALGRLGVSSCIALREPSLGPCMGVKGGATGGGASRIVPMESINLHFTGDLHAVTTAHNLLAATLDNRLFHGEDLGIDPRRVTWRRVIDMNDRALRNCVIGLGGATQGVPRETGFDITAASEVMAMLCLTEGRDDLRARIDRTLVALTRDGAPVTAGRLGVTGAMLALLDEAMMPNLVQTVEGTPAVVHGGPFANIAHGCNSVLATRMALHHADWVVTEAGFGFDLGAEKFFDIKCRSAGLDPAVVVLVATVRALKLHGGVKYEALSTPDPAAVERGLENLERHLDSVRVFGKEAVVAINRFAADSPDELAVVERACERLGVPCALADHFARGGEGALTLAERVIEVGSRPSAPFTPTYDLRDSLEDKVRAVATKIYGADGVTFAPQAERAIAEAKRLGYGGLPICIAKTQSSLSDDPKRLGRPRGFTLAVRDIQVSAGAGFVVVLTGDLLRMPGLPKEPAAERIDVVDGAIRGLI